MSYPNAKPNYGREPINVLFELMVKKCKRLGFELASLLISEYRGKDFLKQKFMILSSNILEAKWDKPKSNHCKQFSQMCVSNLVTTCVQGNLSYRQQSSSTVLCAWTIQTSSWPWFYVTCTAVYEKSKQYYSQTWRKHYLSLLSLQQLKLKHVLRC